MPKKIDPLNKKYFGAVSVMLTVADVKSAAGFYQKALGFKRRALMTGPDGKPMHAELRLRDTTVMLGPEFPEHGSRGPKSVGGTVSTLYVYVDNVDKVVARAVKMGATQQQPVMDMFWGDRCGTIVDPEGHKWMIGTHKVEPTPAQMKKAMKEQMGAAAAA